MRREEETARLDQPEVVEDGLVVVDVAEATFADAIRAVAMAYGYNPTTITIGGDGNAGRLHIRDTGPVKVESQPRTLGYDISAAPPEGFAKRVLDILQGAADVYKDRNAVYKDNFRMVGKTMEALFPEGRPPLVHAAEYDRWHIFELLIVKLTRYANNYDTPHEDSLLDMLPYLGILGGLDQELRERFEDERAKMERERLSYEEAIGRRSRRQHTEDSGPNYEADDPDDDLLDV